MPTLTSSEASGHQMIRTLGCGLESRPCLSRIELDCRDHHLYNGPVWSLSAPIGLHMLASAEVQAINVEAIFGDELVPVFIIVRCCDNHPPLGKSHSGTGSNRERDIFFVSRYTDSNSIME